MPETANLSIAPRVFIRKSFSFGPVWGKAVLAGKITDHDKLVAHAIRLKIGPRSDVSCLQFDELLKKVQTKLMHEIEN